MIFLVAVCRITLNHVFGRGKSVLGVNNDIRGE